MPTRQHTHKSHIQMPMFASGVLNTAGNKLNCSARVRCLKIGGNFTATARRLTPSKMAAGRMAKYLATRRRRWGGEMHASTNYYCSYYCYYYYCYYCYYYYCY